MSEERILKINYTNHRGDRRMREITPTGQLQFMSTQWHPEAQWLFPAVAENGEVKHFALLGLDDTAELKGGFAQTIDGLSQKLEAANVAYSQIVKEVEAASLREADLQTQIISLQAQLANKETAETA